MSLETLEDEENMLLESGLLDLAEALTKLESDLAPGEVDAWLKAFGVPR